MADYPFLIALNNSLPSGGRITLSYQVQTNEQIIVHDLMYSRTATFSLYGLRTNQWYYANINESNPILSTFLKKVGNEYNNIGLFDKPLVIMSGDTLYLDVVDTGAATETLYILLAATRKVGN